jgi:hypothetical protein
MPAYSYKQVNITDIIRGDAFEASFEIAEAFSLAGKSVKAQVREASDADSAVLEFSTEDNSIQVIGQVIVLKKKATLMNIAAGSYVYDVQFFTNADDVVTIFGGKFIIKQDVTK